jgi:hypothetical protein
MPVEVHPGARLGMHVGKSKTLLQINYISIILLCIPNAIPILQNTPFRTISHINDAILLRICTNIVQIEGETFFWKGSSRERALHIIPSPLMEEGGGGGER